MKSAACRRRASDAEQSAWAYSMTAECEPVKEEPEWGECGVSEAAVAEGLYAGHEVKDEVVIGPEVVQKQDVAFSMQSALNRIEEGLCRPLPEGGADAAPACTHSRPGDGPRCNRSPELQYGLRSCVVRLEPLPAGDLHRSKPCNSMQADPSAGALRRSGEPAQRCSRNLTTPLAKHQQSVLNRTEEDPCKLKPAGDAGAAPECTHTRPGEGPRCNTSHKQQLKLGSCSVRLERILVEDLPTCNTCLVIFGCKSSLRNHSCAHLEDKPYFYKEACDETAKTYFKCDNCGKQYLRKRHLVNHLATHHVETGDKPFSCYVCKLQFTYRNSLTVHRRTHMGEKPFSCDLCTSRFTKKSGLARHRQTHTGEKPYYCDVCKSQFSDKSNLARHRRSHTGEKPFSCDICKLPFTQRSYLARHRRTHTGEKPFSCDVCKSQFTQKSVLVRHIRTHTGEKPFSCDICKSRFTQSNNLAKHKRTHTGQKPFSCDICTSRFTKKSGLARHRQTHTGEKPYFCDVCKSQYSQRSHLAQHMRTHTGEKPFSCDVCKSQFRQKSNLTAHRRTHTGEKPFSCDVCKLRFSEKGTLTKHRRTHTGEKPFSCDIHL